MKIVFDLDGTICFAGKPLSTNMVQVLDVLATQGHELIFASARPIRDLLPVLPPHMQQFAMVGGNGSFVAAGGSIISTVHFDQETKDNIIRLIHEFQADYLIDSQWDYSYSGDQEHPIRRNLDPDKRAQNKRLEELTEIVKVVILHTSEPQRLWSELQKLPIVIYRHGSENIIDMSPSGIHKWAGLQKLGLEPKEYIAFGNDANDVSMFQHAKHSICIGNHTELLRVASEQVANDENQVIDRINQLMHEL
ncbi:HAD family phosphatase [Paenibacillus albiflavus]|uniref:HAD family phosphatase n=1 Tax=Paenibacillus albiflavus TaxID=2545760 RepID=A0A4R4EQI0_9BACL|nr:HAD-IIB family hydrolase [Paenibacillus albiflavus]TCZ80851.1 HAD family phosphatase [Paenibacillus albiflavus]